MKTNKADWLAAGHACLVSLSILLISGAFVLLGLPQFGPTYVTYPAGSGLASKSAVLPYAETTDGVTTFTVDVTFRLTPLSASVIRLAPDDCIEEYSVDGETPHDLRQTARGPQCWPYAYPINLVAGAWDSLHTVRLTIKNEGGRHGIDARGSLADPAMLAACLAVWLAVIFPVWPWMRRPSRSQDAPFARFLRRLILCSVGAVFTAGVLWNADGELSLNHGRFVALAVASTAVGLLFRALDGVRTNPLPQRLSVGWALFGFAAFVAAALEAVQTFEPGTRFLLLLLGVTGSAFAVTPFLQTIHRVGHAPGAGAVALLAAAMPFAFDEYRFIGWRWLVGPTTHAVAAVLGLLGYDATVSFGTHAREDGTVDDYYGYVTTHVFSVKIGSWCGGFEGIAMFLFLLAVFVLYDWRAFSRVRRLWIPFALAVPYLFAVNVVRIAGILAYALSVVGPEGADAAILAAVETFHSNIGWMVDSVAFGPFIWVVYKLSARVR